MRTVYRLLGLARSYGAEAVDAACAGDLGLNVVDVDNVARMLEQERERAPLPAEDANIVGAPSGFACDAQEFQGELALGLEADPAGAGPPRPLRVLKAEALEKGLDLERVTGQRASRRGRPRGPSPATPPPPKIMRHRTSRRRPARPTKTRSTSAVDTADNSSERRRLGRRPCQLRSGSRRAAKGS